MVEEGKDVAVIEYHSGDEYQNNYGTSRLSYYGVTGFPTVKFDGILSSVGAGGDMYPTYLSKYNQRINIMSDYTIDVTGTNIGLIDYEINVNVEKVAGGSIDNPRLHVAVTETDIPEFWGGLSEVNFVERLMLPDQNGTTLDFSGSSTEEVVLNFSLDQSWVNEKCAIVVFVQNQSTKEVYQGAVYELSDFITTNTTDAALLAVTTPDAVCHNVFSPKVEIANYGLDNLTSLDINYEVNGGTLMTHNWTGDLAFLETEIVELSELSFDILINNTFSVSCENPNGSNDQYPPNNDISTSFQEAAQVESPVGLMLKFDDNPEETSWELLDSQNNVLYSGDGYTSSTPIFVFFDLTYTDCYSFKIYDEGGDGLSGSGLFNLFYSQNPAIVFYNSATFGFEQEVQFSIDITGITEESIADRFSIYPNPIVNNANVTFVLEAPGMASLKVYNTLGKLVLDSEAQYYSSGKQLIPFNRRGFEPGLYFFTLEMGDSKITQKVILK